MFSFDFLFYFSFFTPTFLYSFFFPDFSPSTRKCVFFLGYFHSADLVSCLPLEAFRCLSNGEGESVNPERIWEYPDSLWGAERIIES